MKHFTWVYNMDRFRKDRALIYLQQTSRNLKLKDSEKTKWQAVFSVRPRIRGDFGFKTVTSAQSHKHANTHTSCLPPLVWTSFKQTAVANFRTQSRARSTKKPHDFLVEKRKNAAPKRPEKVSPSWFSVRPEKRKFTIAVASKMAEFKLLPLLTLRPLQCPPAGVLSFTISKSF